LIIYNKVKPPFPCPSIALARSSAAVRHGPENIFKKPLIRPERANCERFCVWKRRGNTERRKMCRRTAHGN